MSEGVSGKEKDHQRGLFRLSDHERATGGDGHEHFDCKGHAHPRHGKGPARDGNKPDQRGYDKSPMRMALTVTRCRNVLSKL